jgi:hypothetical protein
MRGPRPARCRKVASILSIVDRLPTPEAPVPDRAVAALRELANEIEAGTVRCCGLLVHYRDGDSDRRFRPGFLHINLDTEQILASNELIREYALKRWNGEG